MGGSSAKIGKVDDTDLRTVLCYNLREDHLRTMWKLFREIDTDYSYAWSVQELYKVVQEPRLSVRAPIIDALFFMGDSKSQGALTFSDMLVLFSCFCSLSREEVLQLLFIIIDRDRNGRVDRHEIMDFFSYVPVGSGGERTPVFPVNNKNSLDMFRHGKWDSLEFDGLAQLCSYFPYISYPAYHTQELFREVMLGKAFWEKLVNDRTSATAATRSRRVAVPGTNGKEKVEARLPGKCTMQELLEYSRRQTEVHGGRRVAAQQSVTVYSKLTKERDAQIASCPILTMIRNPRCMYYIPRDVTNASVQQQDDDGMLLDSQMQEAANEVVKGGPAPPKGVVLRPGPGTGVGIPPGLQDRTLQEDDDSDASSEGSYESDEDDDEDDDDDGPASPASKDRPASSPARLPLPPP